MAAPAFSWIPNCPWHLQIFGFLYDFQVLQCPIRSSIEYQPSKYRIYHLVKSCSVSMVLYWCMLLCTGRSQQKSEVVLKKSRTVLRGLLTNPFHYRRPVARTDFYACFKTCTLCSQFWTSQPTANRRLTPFRKNPNSNPYDLLFPALFFALGEG